MIKPFFIFCVIFLATLQTTTLPSTAAFVCSLWQALPSTQKEALCSRNELFDEMLKEAVDCQDFETAVYALRMHADVHRRLSHHAEPLLVYVCRVHHSDTRASFVRLLLNYKAQVQAADVFGHTALHWAYFYGDIACVRLLLEQGADPSAFLERLEDPFGDGETASRTVIGSRALIYRLFVAWKKEYSRNTSHYNNTLRYAAFSPC